MNDLLKRQSVATSIVNKYLFSELQWGTIDCATLVCEVLNAFAISNPLQATSTYKTRTGALRFMRKHGESMAAIVGGLEVQPITPAEAIECDLVAIPSGDEAFGEGLGVVIGPNKLIAFIEVNGVIKAEIAELNTLIGLTEVKAWRVA